MNAKYPIKISQKGMDFLDNLQRNRIKTDTDKKGLYYWQTLEIIADYFKLDNPSYLKLIKIKWSKNA